MSAKLLNKLLEEAYNGEKLKRKIAKEARKRVDSAGLHLINITEDDIYDILVYNYVAIKRPKLISAQRKKLKESKEKDTSRAEAARQVIENDSTLSKELRAEARQVAKLIFKDFVKEYNKSISDKAYKAVKKGRVIEVLQPKNQADKTKNTIVSLLKTSSANTILSSLTVGKALQSFTRRTQFLHQGKTVGVQILEDIAKSASGLPNSKGKTAAIKVLERMLNEVEYSWSANDSYTKRSIQVVGRLGQTLANKPGQESTDWTVLRPKLEEALYEELQGSASKFATKPGSQPFDERLAKQVANQLLLDPLSKKKNIKASKFKVDKPTKKKGTSKKKRSASPKPGGLKKRRGRKVVEKSSTEVKGKANEGLQLLALLNLKLQAVVARNMVTPALNYRTGRFAASVRATDIQTTAKGFPSIGYTYQRNPYETFEVGNLQGDPERDPRRLIDKSIREIAAEMAIGRFYTRRV
jgi:hypothetical protein